MAHRGIAPMESENTYTAFREARRRGFRAIETDLRVTSDGEFVMMHDARLQRTAARPERVSQLRLADLRQVRTRGGDRIPTLEGVLRWSGSNGMSVVLHLKAVATGWNDTRLIRVLEEVDRYDMTDEVTYLSAHKAPLRAIERLDSSRRTAWIVPPDSTVLRAARSVDEVVMSAPMVNAALVRKLHRVDVQVIGRPTQRRSELEAFARAGVAHVLTDRLDPIAARNRPASQPCAPPFRTEPYGRGLGQSGWQPLPSR